MAALAALRQQALSLATEQNSPPLPHGLLFPLLLDVTVQGRRIREFILWPSCPDEQPHAFEALVRQMTAEEFSRAVPLHLEQALVQRLKEQVPRILSHVFRLVSSAARTRRRPSLLPPTAPVNPPMATVP